MSDFRPVYSGPSYDDAFDDHAGRSSSPLPSHDQARAAIDLTCAPKPRRYLVRDLLPHPVCGLVIAPGGTGKSFLTLSLAVAISTARLFLDVEVDEPGSVVIIAGEDDLDELHRRFVPIMQRETAFLEESEALAVMRDAQSRLYVVSRVGEDSRLLGQR